jgi:hypothetical protein
VGVERLISSWSREGEEGGKHRVRTGCGGKRESSSFGGSTNPKKESILKQECPKPVMDQYTSMVTPDTLHEKIPGGLQTLVRELSVLEARASIVNNFEAMARLCVKAKVFFSP